MKLKIEPRPAEYSADKAAMLRDIETGELILIGAPQALRCAKEIRRAVNFHVALVAALTPFRSVEMGMQLIDTIGDGDTKLNFTRLIYSIDEVLDEIDLMQERDEAL